MTNSLQSLCLNPSKTFAAMIHMRYKDTHHESEPAREYPMAKVDRPAPQISTGNLMNRESAHCSLSTRVKGNFEQIITNVMKENGEIQMIKNNIEAEDEKLSSCNS